MGYWIAASINDTRPMSVKSYLDCKCHENCSGSELLEEVCRVNDLGGPSIQQLIDFARVQEVDEDPDLVGAVVQVRGVRYPSSRPEAKMYFMPVRRKFIGLKRAISRIATLANDQGSMRVRQIQQELLRRDAICPIFYITVAYRPRLEIETYHDIQKLDDAPWLPEAVCQMAQDLTGIEAVAARSQDITRTAGGHGFSCRHISCDLLGGDQALSLFFDHPDWRRAKNKDYRALLKSICALDGSGDPMPKGKDAFRISATHSPMMIGTKISCTSQAKFRTIIDEIDPSVGDLV